MLPGPLHRVTKLRDDPATAWLGWGSRWEVKLKELIVWLGYFVVIRAVWWSTTYFLESLEINVRVLGFITLPRMIAVSLAGALLFPARYLAVLVRAGATAKRAKTEAEAVAAQVDDLRDVAALEDGQIVSVVGWVRGHGYLLHRAADEQAVGLALPCRGQHLVETLHNFDLVGESGDEALIVAEGARLLGRPTVNLSRANQEDRALVHSLDLPVGVVPTYWSALVIRDGDPVMVVGTKKTVHDMTRIQQNRPTALAAVGSTPARPLLIVPLAAERRQV